MRNLNTRQITVLSFLIVAAATQATAALPPEYLDAIRILKGKSLGDATGTTYCHVRIRIPKRIPTSPDVVVRQGWLSRDRKSVVLWDGLAYPVIAVVGPANLDAARRSIRKASDQAFARTFLWWDQGLTMSNPAAAAVWYMVGEEEAAREVFARSTSQAKWGPPQFHLRVWLASRHRYEFFDAFSRGDYGNALSHLKQEEFLSQIPGESRNGEVYGLRSGKQNTVEELILEVKRRISSPAPKTMIERLENVAQISYWGYQGDPIYNEAIAKGIDLAPELITTIFHDKRLTRAEFPSRNFADGSLLSVELLARNILASVWPESQHMVGLSEQELRDRLAVQKGLTWPEKLAHVLEDSA